MPASAIAFHLVVAGLNRDHSTNALLVSEPSTRANARNKPAVALAAAIPGARVADLTSVAATELHNALPRQRYVFLLRLQRVSPTLVETMVVAVLDPATAA